ncbi:SIFV.gp51-like protein [Sulfolobus islandicus filamentous virus 2]|uniref:SIFV.gp51-like protein n=1 Tax=Sulfolobus islandicus filamentous virus 2 TaxID=1902331 RepID=A0A1D8BJB3_SIFV|nr:SIFV.gp51-like protein [Sulfolobus islandicus filamentous virus 2]
MSYTTPTYTASVSNDILRYMMAYATGNDGCIQSMSALFQPSGESVTGYNVGTSNTTEAGFIFQQLNIPQGVGVNIIFFSTTIPQNTFFIDLRFTTTQSNTYQLVQINTLPPNPNYALVIIVTLTVTAQPASNINISPLLQAFTSFASNQCTTAQPPSLSYTGSGFTIFYENTYVSGTIFNAILIAQNTLTSSNTIQISATINGYVVATATISTPALGYAYFLFALTLVFTSE